MDNVILNPYLFFDGQCKEAMDFYKSVFGGELTMQTYGEVPGMDVKEEDKNRVMHARLESGKVIIMASDTPQASPESKKIELSIGGENEELLKAAFENLSQGGKVKTPLRKEFWGDTFGQLTDKYGIDWMVNIAAKK
jgi:PhnB protein